MKITFISDTHGSHDQLKLEPTDMLIHAGDISKLGQPEEIQKFLDWWEALPVKHKIFIGGNHDFYLEKSPGLFRRMLSNNYVYLENREIEIEGIKIWGSPITPYFFNWAFNRQRGAEIRKYWEQIPKDIDILITHGPPLGVGDRTTRGEAVGCEDLLEIVKKIQPKYHVFGHIHEAYGVYQEEGITFVNASVLNLSYQMVNPPVIINYDF